MRRPLIVAAAQPAIVPGDVERNAIAHAERVRAAAAGRALRWWRRAAALIKVLQGLGATISTSAKKTTGRLGNGGDPDGATGAACGGGSVQVDDELGKRVHHGGRLWVAGFSDDATGSRSITGP